MFKLKFGTFAEARWNAIQYAITLWQFCENANNYENFYLDKYLTGMFAICYVDYIITNYNMCHIKLLAFIIIVTIIIWEYLYEHVYLCMCKQYIHLIDLISN